MFIRFFLLIALLISSFYANDNFQKVSLQLLWKHQFEFAGFYMAKEKGFYKDAGLDVQIKEYEYGINIVSDVEKGKSTYGVGYPSIILDKLNGSKINLLSATFQSSPHIFVTLNSSNIKSIEDFKNKKVMIENDTVKTTALLSMLYSKKVHPNDFITIPSSFNIDDLINGKVDVYTAYISNELYKLNNANIDYSIWDPKDYGFDFYNDLLFTSTKELTQNPSRVKNFNEASIKGWLYAFNNIDETIKVILSKYNSQNKSKEALLYEAKQLKQLAFTQNKKFGTITKTKIQRIIDIYNLMGFVHNKVNLNEFIYNPKKIMLTKEEKEYLAKNPILKVHNESYWPPFNYNESNTPKGFSIDYMNLLASKLNIQVDYINGPNWSEFLSMLKNKQIDLMLNIVQTPKRDEYIKFTTPYKKHTMSLFTNRKDINSLKDLNGKSIAITKSFFTEEFLKKNYPKITIHTYSNSLECIKAVIEGKSHALLESLPVVNYLLQKNNLSIAYTKLNIDKRLEFDFRIGISHQTPILKNIIQKAMNSLNEDELYTLNNKWLGFNHFMSDINSVQLTKDEKKYLDNNKITMCIDPNWMPFESFENKEHIGISADYFKLFEQNLGKKIDIIYTENWPKSLEYAKQRKCDLLSLVMETPSRKKFLNFTTPYLNVPLVIATKIEVTFINDIKSLKDKKIGIPKGYAFVELLKTKYPYLNIVEVEHIQDGLEKVSKGKLFGYIGTLASVGYMFQSQFTGELKIAGKFDETWKLGIGVRNDNKTLLNIMEKTVASIDKTGQQSILNNWLAIKYEQKIDYKFLWQVLLVIGIILLFLAYRQYLLKKNNKDLQIAVEEKTKELTELNKNLEIRIEKAIEENSQKDRILFTQSKMASMGEMIGNIAHQWRQPLSIISTAASAMKIKIEMGIFEPKEEINNLDKLIDATQYLSDTIDDFKNYLKPSKEREEFNIKSIIEKNLNMFGKGFSTDNITFILDIEDITINGSENELLQVIINILNNSKDKLNEISDEKKLIFITTTQTKEHIKLSFKDNGGGIEKAVLDRIFDAYFTTKHKSIGTGLGLYMSYQIIKNSFNGEIVASNEDYEYKDKNYKGAQFQIILPK